PIRLEPQVVTVRRRTNANFDDVPSEATARFHSELRETIRHRHDDILAEIRDTGQWTDELAERVVEVTKEFKKGFTTSEGKPLVGEESVDPMDADKVGQESVKVHRPATVKK